MRMMNGCSRWSVAMSLIAIVLVSGCSKKKPPVVTPPPSESRPTTPPTPPPPPPPPPAPAPAPAALSEEEVFARKTLDQLNAERPLGDVLFELDSSTLSEEARGVLQRNAEWLKKWDSTKATVEGHCDSRGSSEYNIALGERRAETVRSYLASLGVGIHRLANVSKGEEDPVCREENDGCWSQNRRGHFILTAK